jgi:hypothetical protein
MMMLILKKKKSVLPRVFSFIFFPYTRGGKLHFIRNHSYYICIGWCAWLYYSVSACVPLGLHKELINDLNTKHMFRFSVFPIFHTHQVEY